MKAGEIEEMKHFLSNHDNEDEFWTSYLIAKRPTNQGENERLMFNKTCVSNGAGHKSAPIMNVIIESLIFDFDNKVRETVFELINRIPFTKYEKE